MSRECTSKLFFYFRLKLKTPVFAEMRDYDFFSYSFLKRNFIPISKLYYYIRY